MENAVLFHGLEHSRKCSYKANPAICATTALRWILAHPGERFTLSHLECILCLRRILPEDVAIGKIIARTDEDTKRPYIVFVPNPPIKK